MKSVEVRFLPGERVVIGDIRGYVTAVSIYYPNRTRYEVKWWDSGTRREEWFDDFEIESREVST